MLGYTTKRLTLIAFSALLCASALQAQDWKLTLPRSSKLTPVQRLNREGVEAVEKKQYDKAESIFYKAYLYDPADPFTLNNLGYISELQGNLDRAQKFYTLASEQGGSAIIDRSNARQLEGKPMTYALNNLKDTEMRVNYLNVQAIELLSQHRSREATGILKQALALDPHNAFTLNNLGVSTEAGGDYDNALQYFDQAASAQSHEPVVVTLKHEWRGKPVSQLASDSANRLREKIRRADTPQAQAALLLAEGVSAVNQNDWASARQDFLKAYRLDPYSGFSLNDVGYVAEKDGDLETAEFFYARAKHADNANVRVGLASQQDVEGKRLNLVAADSDGKVDTAIDLFAQSQHEQTGPVVLRRRDNSIVQPSNPAAPKTDSPAATPHPAAVPQAPRQ
jgi:Flp pilus assembly protein TadD